MLGVSACPPPGSADFPGLQLGPFQVREELGADQAWLLWLGGLGLATRCHRNDYLNTLPFLSLYWVAHIPSSTNLLPLLTNTLPPPHPQTPPSP